jgi:hypothetical protein
VNSKQRSLNHRLQAKSKCTHLHSTISADSTFSVRAVKQGQERICCIVVHILVLCSICFYFVSMRECQQVSGFATTIYLLQYANSVLHKNILCKCKSVLHIRQFAFFRILMWIKDMLSWYFCRNISAIFPYCYL